MLGKVAGALAAVLLVGGGLWAWLTFGPADQQPRFESISIEPVTLRFVGGQIVVQARIANADGLKQVSGVVMRGDSQWLELPAKGPSESSPEFTYLAEFQAPVNTSSNGEEETYSLRLVVVNSAGREAEAEATFHVLAASLPPAPPPGMAD